MKIRKTESVLHDWVHELSFQMQALLMTGMRGPDGIQKECSAKVIVRYLRGCVLKPAGDWKGDNDNDFMWGNYKFFQTWNNNFWNDHDYYPHHFIMHLLHCAEVVGYMHPDEEIGRHWLKFYLSGCKSFHMNHEKKDEMQLRLNDFGLFNHIEQAPFSLSK